jgi:hypothetical protein
MNDVLGYIRVILPRYAEAAQRKAMGAHSIRYVQEGGKHGNGSRDALLRMVRPGTVVAILHLHLLADPKSKRKRGGTRADLWSCIDAIENKGGTFWELYTGLRSDNREGRDRMTREAVETLARGRHKTRASDKRGRPAKTWPENVLAKNKAAWESRKYKTWAEAEAHFIGGMEARDAWKLWGRRDTEER